MNKLRFLTWSVVLLLLLNAGTLVYLFIGKKPEQRPPMGGAPGFIVEQLKLDPQQQEQFFELRRQHQDITRKVHDEDRRLHDIYFGLLKTDNPDKEKVDSVSSLMAAQRSLLESATFSHFQQLRQLCRDDQKKLFDATIDEIARRISPKGPGPGGPPPPER